MSAKLKAVLRGTAVTAFWLGVWWGIAAAVGQELLVPSPLAVLAAFGRLVPTTDFWIAVALSLLRICVGFVAALPVGVLLAVLTVRFKTARALISPILQLVRAAPVASFIILALVWIDYDILPAVIAFLMVLPMIWVNTEEGIRRTDRNLLEMAHQYRVPSLRILTQLYIPSVKPFFLTACVNGLGFAWKSGVAAEVISRPDHAIGNHLFTAKIHLETPEVFAWTAVVVVLSILLERLLLHVTASVKRKEATYDHTA